MNGGEVYLVGLGVVGMAVADAHLRAGIPVTVMDAEASALNGYLGSIRSAHRTSSIGNASHGEVLDGLHTAKVCPQPNRVRPSDQQLKSDRVETCQSTEPILIESIAERLEIKQEFFQRAQHELPANTLYFTNTSTLPIGSIAAELARPESLAGMHFFMPVDQRPGVEVIAGDATAERTVDACVRHAERLGKKPFRVGDSPGFVVNRMLSPYVNRAITLLCQGATAEQIENAALSFGMPISPLELVDLISLPTALDGGRVYWQAYPQRVKSSPLLPMMLKNGRTGRRSGRGLYDYQNDQRSPDLATETRQLVRKYSRDQRSWTDVEVEEQLSLSMLAEAVCILDDQVVDDPSVVDTAMQDGLGFRRSFFGYFADRDRDWLHERLNQELDSSGARLQIPEAIAHCLSNVPSSPIRAAER